METFEDYGIILPSRRRYGNVKCTCPNCKNSGRSHPEDKSLSVNLDQGLWNCHYCGWSGGLKGYEGRRTKVKRQYKRPGPIKESDYSQKFINYWSLRGISEATLKKMHIAEGLEFMPQVGRKMNTVQFPYYLEGELINVKYRTGDKKFKMVQDAELIPYNIDGIRDKDTAILVEGEADALSFVEIGFDNVVSVPNGANANLEWLDEFQEGWFDDKKTIYIAVDTDQKGLMLRDELVRRFGPERCMIVTWGEGCKDANDHLKKYGKQSLKGCVASAKEVKIGGVFSVEDYGDELDAIYHGGGLQPGMTIGLPNFDALVSFETKRLCIITGEPGSGKSEFIDEMCVRLNLKYQIKVGFFSPENMPLSYHAIKLMEKLGGRKLEQMAEEQYQRVKGYLGGNFFHILPDENYQITTILEKALFLVRRKGIKVLVLDPFNRIESTGSNEIEFIRKLLVALTNFAQRNDVLVCLMAHPRKINKTENADGVPTLNDISGSKDFWNTADYGIIVHRDRENKTTKVRVSKIRYRHLGKEGDCEFKYNVNNGRYAPYNEGVPTVFDDRDFLVYGLEKSDDYAPQAQQPQVTPEQDQLPPAEETNPYNFSTPPPNVDFWQDKPNECPF